MNVIETPLPGVVLLEPAVFSDDRGFFLESYNERVFAEIGIREKFVQDNHSYSKRGVVRGLHYQIERPQGKLVRAVSGEVLDVIVDLRRSSPTCGRWHGVTLTDSNRRLVWIPPGYAHGFRVLSEGAHVLYKATEFYFAHLDRTVLWNDPHLAIDWQGADEPLLSEKDRRGVRFQDAELFP
ncbi:MAG: dTDP-4-dehydrorhamnose 3,5-epimerase [Acidobacteria bacterium]|nr:dTDP-4-dehydrorhamnose 3,5-epimerase [Acidobacteriota bacterium]